MMTDEIAFAFQANVPQLQAGDGYAAGICAAGGGAGRGSGSRARGARQRASWRRDRAIGLHQLGKIAIEFLGKGLT